MCDVVVGVVGVVNSGGGEVVSGGDAVTMVAGRQEPLTSNVTSARCVQVESGGGVNCRAITGCTVFCDMHILTRESQEVMAGTENVLTNVLDSSIDEAVRSLIV